jgi:hypothetical protein
MSKKSVLFGIFADLTPVSEHIQSYGCAAAKNGTTYNTYKKLTHPILKNLQPDCPRRPAF